MPHIPSIRHCVIVCVFLSMFWTIPSLLSAYEPNLPQLSETHQPDLFAISSDKDAISLFKKKLQSKLQLTQGHTRHNRKTFLKHSAPEPKSEIVTLVANLLASRLAVTIQSTTQQDEMADIHHPLTDQQVLAHEWMMTHPLPTSMTKLVAFLTNFSNYYKTFTSFPKRPSHFDVFAQYVDQHYPKLTGSTESWIGILEQGKTSDISKRLYEYWEQEPSQGQPLAPTSDQDKADIDGYAHYYSWTRLLPIFKAHLIALSIQAESESIQLAEQSFINIKKWHSAQAREREKARLCGTWHWIVHNHQNHGDHKMTIFFGDSTQHTTNQPQPAEMKINGNTVYLLWKFPKGHQEDSLLLSNNDKRLEGSFKNTLGPYGSITGKRISSCKP